MIQLKSEFRGQKNQCPFWKMNNNVGWMARDLHLEVEERAEYRILEAYIRNPPSHPSPLIEPYLRDAGFSYVALVGRGCKLDSTLISVLVERWRPETHIFHLPCGECTITLEDVQLQLELPVDGSVVTRSVQAADWRDVCAELLGKVSETIFRGRMEISWLRRNFSRLDEDSTEVQREQHARAYILQIIGGILMPDKSRNLVHLR
ncbi:protein MAINTENANCE OF MERISTEMS-like [Gossypium raimondii]|uniref:protein MAINTENANCE OF MERISTEMS-like n=1 Tax=Gossypium raimondii TaxID=29730 RepID=UPI00227C47CC|nr:protein MAINTENANCE OF MERISTEMS-like [Gossypium raimondii]